MVQIDQSNFISFLPEGWFSARLPALERARAMLAGGDGPGGAYTGWVRLPANYDREEFTRIQAAAKKIRSNSKALIVVGIGGSYLGARAVIELLGRGKDSPEIYFAGNGLSTDALLETIEKVRDVDFSVNVISKSGTTTEPAVAFRIFKSLLEEKYGKEGARERIYATTDAKRGALKGLADREGYEEFVVPDAVGGRYSVLTAVGLLPIAAAGIDIESLMAGAARSMEDLSTPGGRPRCGQPGLAVRRRPPRTVSKRQKGGAAGQLRALLPLLCRVVEAALRRERGKRGQGALPRQRRIYRRSPLHGSVHPAGRAADV